MAARRLGYAKQSEAHPFSFCLFCLRCSAEPGKRRLLRRPDSIRVPDPIARLALMAKRENQHGVLRFLETVERHMAGAPARYHQFAQGQLDRASDQWMTNQQADGFLDQAQRFKRSLRIGRGRNVGQPFQPASARPE